jgi:hypothetical protein
MQSLSKTFGRCCMILLLASSLADAARACPGQFSAEAQAAPATTDRQSPSTQGAPSAPAACGGRDSRCGIGQVGMGWG